MSGLTYDGAGVHYSDMDPFKVGCQETASGTDHFIDRFGYSAVSASRGESVFLIDVGGYYLAHVEEGLGTKYVVADAVRAYGGPNRWDAIAIDTVAMAVNDLITLGALPISYAAHVAAGESEWFADMERVRAWVHGMRQAMSLSRCVWGGGESPTLRDTVTPGAVVLSGSAVGQIKPKKNRIDPSYIRAGDIIYHIYSSGVGANGLTLCRKLADSLPDGYHTRMQNGRMYGEALLDPTIIYVQLMESLLNAGIVPHYAVNVTGHGYCKIMRAPQPFTYVIDTLPPQRTIFHFIQEKGGISDREMYGTFNMGTGFILILDPDDVTRVEQCVQSLPSGMFAGTVGGHVENGPKRVIVKRGPRHLDIEFAEESLKVR